jgi:hypothetical protein
VAALGCINALAGDLEAARGAIAELDALAERSYVTPADRAVVFTAMGETDQAFADLERAYQERSGALVYLRVDPDFASLAADPRFADLVRRMNFPG